MQKPLVAVILGPTATGKTRLSVELASMQNGEIISADSMQIYKRMDIGTAKPTIEERRDVPHHMMDVAEPCEAFSVASYVKAAKDCIDGVLERDRLPIIVGGTGLYITSLIDNVQFADIGEDLEYRQSLADISKEQGTELLWSKLEKIDPVMALKISKNDEKRIIRALEVYYLTKMPMSHFVAKSKETPSPYDFIQIGLAYNDREKLYAAINQRVDIMTERGLIDEVRTLIMSGVPVDSTAMQAIGYKELIAHINGEMMLDEALERIKQESRRYAKRQLTWFRRDKSINWFEVDVTVFDDVIKQSVELIINARGMKAV